MGGEAEGQGDPPGQGSERGVLSHGHACGAAEPGAEGGVGKAAAIPRWADGPVRTYGIKVSIQNLKLYDRVKKLSANIW